MNKKLFTSPNAFNVLHTPEILNYCVELRSFISLFRDEYHVKSANYGIYMRWREMSEEMI